MAYVQPDGVCEFFGSLGLTANYDDSLYFPDHVTRDNYFSSLPKIATCNALTYSREQRGFIRVEQPMSIMIYASYMRFKNTSFENKWFYAFVKNVEYINNNCVQVNFEIDPLITWMGVFHLNECFIERQHTIGDAIGANICEEGFALGSYVVEGEQFVPTSEYVIMLYKTYKEGETGSPTADAEPPEAITQGTYVPIVSYAYPLDSTNLGLLWDKLKELTEDNRIDEVIALKLVPIEWTNTGTSVAHRTPQFSFAKPYTQIGGSTYTPRNKKLFTYPYKYLEVDNCEGQRNAYKYEYFNTIPDTESSGSCAFDIMGTACTPEVEVMCTPVSYNHQAFAYDESISMKDFPSLAWNVDSYKAYIAQRDSTIFGEQMANMITSPIIGGATGLIAGGPAGAAVGVASGAIKGLIGSGATHTLLSDTLNEMRSGDLPARKPNETRGTLSSNLMVQDRKKGFRFRAKSITKNYAMMIDSFFDMYGYAIKQHGIPNMDARPHWTYVKTKGCSVDGALPADDAQAIENIFNKGIRFWKNHNEIGNYGYDNSPSA